MGEVETYLAGNLNLISETRFPVFDIFLILSFEYIKKYQNMTVQTFNLLTFIKDTFSQIQGQDQKNAEQK